MSPLVSILIPCFNAAPWLARTLDSAIAQTWPRLEIIVVDDGSLDGSADIARAYGRKSVRLVSQANRGAAAARNLAMREAKGDYLQFLDADDLLSPEKIALQVALLAGRPPGTLATCAWGRFADDPREAQFVDQAVYRDFEPIAFLVLAARTGAMMHPSAWLVPRAVADRAGPWDESLTLNDDGEFFCRVMLSSAGIAFTPDARSFYRSRLSSSLSQRRDERSRRSQFRSVDLMGRHMLAAEDSPRVRRAAANYFQRFIHDFFPFPADLIGAAGSRVAELGGSDLDRPDMGSRTAALARAIGWKNVWRLKHLLFGGDLRARR